MIDQIYKDIEAHLRALDTALTAHQFGKIKFIAPYIGQYLDTSKHPQFNTPAALVEIANINWGDYNALGQSGTAQVRIHIVMNSFAMGSESSRDQDKYLGLLNYPTEVNKGLQGKEGTNFTGLMRRTDTTDSSPDGLYVHVITYETLVQELATSRKSKYVYTAQDEAELEVTYDSGL